jgi:hypothetical protein
MGFMAQEERMIVSSNETKSRELKSKLDALNVFEQVRLQFSHHPTLPGWIATKLSLDLMCFLRRKLGH